MKIPKLLIAINYVNYKDRKKVEWQKRAIQVLDHNRPENSIVAAINFPWDFVDVPETFYVFNNLKRSSKKVGNDRDLPYVKEVFDICAKLPCSIFGYINSDILLSKEFFTVFNRKWDAYVFYKRDIEDVSLKTFNKKQFKVVWKDPPGCDGFFFKKTWWVKNRKKFHNDLILGETEWDTYYHYRIRSLTKNYLLMRALYHTYHNRVWSEESKGAKNNVAIWEALKKELDLRL